MSDNPSTPTAQRIAETLATIRRGDGTATQWYLYIGGLCVGTMRETTLADAERRLEEIRAVIARACDDFFAGCW